MFRSFFFIFLSLTLLPLSLSNAQHVKAKLLIDRTNFQPSPSENTPLGRIGVHFQIEPGWHIYWKDSGEAGLPTKVRWSHPDDIEMSDLRWPPPLTFTERGDLTTYGYKKEVMLISSVYLPKTISDENSTEESRTMKFRAEVSWLACKDICIPGQASLTTTVDFSSTKPLAPSPQFSLFEKFDPGDKIPNTSMQASSTSSLLDSLDFTAYILAFFSALLAGLILNVMPCVLPIIGIKAMGFINHAHDPPKKVKASALAFAAGIISTFVLFALLVILFRSAGQEIGWGSQFQHPSFVLGLLLIVFILSLGFFDVYCFEVPFLQQATRAISGIETPLTKHFFDGILATLLSTPCTAPFLGSALTVAFLSSSWLTLIIFTAIGIGLALPYILLSFFPPLVHTLPKPGQWMNTVKQFLGFLLLGTVVWLLYVLEKLTNGGAMVALPLLLLIYFAYWIHSSLQSTSASKAKKRLVDIGLIFGCALALWSLWPALVNTNTEKQQKYASGTVTWETYSPSLVEEKLQTGQSVFIDFTADWCITCKANETFVLKTKNVTKLFKEKNIALLKADWTTHSSLVGEALKKYGGTGVPYYVFLTPHSKEPIILPTLLTSGILEEIALR